MLSVAASKFGRAVPTSYLASVYKVAGEPFGSQTLAKMAHHPELKYDTPFNFAAASSKCYLDCHTAVATDVICYET
jgi:hypothetical protein